MIESEVQPTETLYKKYLELFKVLLKQSVKPQVDIQNNYEEEDDESARQSGGVSVLKYREIACDIYCKSFFLLKKAYQEQGEN